MSEFSSSAVEEAAKVLWARVSDRPFSLATQGSKNMFRRRANDALRAALPFLDINNPDDARIDEILASASSPGELSGLSRADAVFQLIASLTTDRGLLLEARNFISEECVENTSASDCQIHSQKLAHDLVKRIDDSMPPPPAPNAPAERFDDGARGGTEEKRK